MARISRLDRAADASISVEALRELGDKAESCELDMDDFYELTVGDEVVVSLSQLRRMYKKLSARLNGHGVFSLMVEELLEQSAAARRAIPTRWLPATEALFEARIPMLNRQGAIAEITTCAGSRGCNIQSIGIDHLTAHTAVLSLVLTDEGDMEAFVHDLRDSGYAVSIGPLTAKEYAHVDG